MFPNVLDRLEDRLTPAFGTSGLVSPTAATTAPVAAVEAAPRLASVYTTQSALLNGLLGSLAGPGAGLNLRAADYPSLANADLNLGTVLGALQSQTGAGTPQQALATDITLGQLLTAAAQAASADGNTASATTLGTAATTLGPAAGTVRLGDLLTVNLPDGSLAQAQVNALDLLTGGVELFNSQNTATTPTSAWAGR